MGLALEYIDGQTPLDEEEKDELLIHTIATRGELDEFEQQNIEQAVQWTLSRSFKPETVFTEDLEVFPLNRNTSHPISTTILEEAFSISEMPNRRCSFFCR